MRSLMLLGISASLSISCANPKADYQEVEEVLSATEQSIQQTSDYDVRIKACDDAITSLQAFLGKHKDGEWADVATSALSAWQSKKSAFQQELNSLFDELSSKLRDKSIEECKKVHPVSNIENIILTSSQKSKDGYNLTVNEAYSVRMRGALLGTSIFKLMVHTSGHIAMDSKKISVDDQAPVEE